MALRKGKRQNLFTKYFLLFVTVFLFMLVVMGIVLTTIVNAYSLSQKTDLLTENTKKLANTISQNMIVNNIRHIKRVFAKILRWFRAVSMRMFLFAMQAEA